MLHLPPCFTCSARRRRARAAPAVDRVRGGGCGGLCTEAAAAAGWQAPPKPKGVFEFEQVAEVAPIPREEGDGTQRGLRVVMAQSYRVPGRVYRLRAPDVAAAQVRPPYGH